MAMLSSAGLPGLNGFVGEILCFFGIFTANKVLAALAVSTAILSAAYLLWLYRRVMNGPLKDPDDDRLRDLDRRELAVLVPVIVLTVFMGLFPGTILRKMDASVARTIEALRTRPAVAATMNPAGLATSEAARVTGSER